MLVWSVNYMVRLSTSVARWAYPTLSWDSTHIALIDHTVYLMTTYIIGRWTANPSSAPGFTPNVCVAYICSLLLRFLFCLSLFCVLRQCSLCIWYFPILCAPYVVSYLSNFFSCKYVAILPHFSCEVNIPYNEARSSLCFIGESTIAIIDYQTTRPPHPDN